MKTTTELKRPRFLPPQLDDVFAASAALEAQGLRFTIEPTDYTVCHAAAILDPDGNTVILHKQADGSFG